MLPEKLARTSKDLKQRHVTIEANVNKLREVDADVNFG
jgi:hypothetical protein